MMTFSMCFSRLCSFRCGRRGGQCYYEQGSPSLSHASSRCPAGCKPMVSHTDDAGGQPHAERPAEHLDRVWPDTGPTDNRLVAASGRPDLPMCRRGTRRSVGVVASAERQSAPPLACAERSGRQETDGGQRCPRHSSHVANPAGGSSRGSLPSSSPGVGMSMLAAHSTSSLSDMCQVVCDPSASR